MPLPRPALFAGEGKVGLFKSLKNLKGSDLRYAIGYNMSTLRMLGVPLAGLVSLPYDIQQTMNTFKRFSQTATSGSLAPSAKRVGVLSFARNVVPKARGALPKTNVGAIDRYTNLYFGRQSREVIKQINKGRGKKAAIKAFFDPTVVDREIQRQAKRPTQQNILHNWQMATYMRAVSGAPDPIRNNPFMQAKNYMAKSKNARRVQPFSLDSRYGITDSKNEHLMMANKRFEEVMGGLEVGAFTNPESHIKAVMDQQMMAYMLETIDKDTNYLRSHLSKNAKAAHRDRRRNFIQNQYAKNNVELSRDIGNQYSLNQDSRNVTEVRNNRTGQLQGYTTSELQNFQKNQVMKGVVPALTSESNFRRSLEGSMVNPDVASLVNNLSVELGFPALQIQQMNASAVTGQLVNALSNIGISMSLDPKDFQKAARTGTINFTNQIRSVINFTRGVDKLGMSSLSDALSGMLVSADGLKALGKTKSLDALETSLSSNDLSNDIIKMAGGKDDILFSSKEMIQGDLVKVRESANNEVLEMMTSGGNMRHGKNKEKIGDYFYSPHRISGGQSVVESAMHYYYDNERDSNNPRYYRSYRSMVYAQNKRKKHARGGFVEDGGSKYFTEGSKAYKVESVPDAITIKSDKFPDRSITMIDGSIKHRIKDVTKQLREYSQVNNGVGLGDAQISMHYELSMLMHIEQELLKGARAMNFTKSKMTKNGQAEKLSMHFVEKHDRTMEAGTGMDRVLQASPDKGHEFSTALMEGQKIPQHLMGWNAGGKSYEAGTTVSNEAQRREETRRERKSTGDNFIPSKMDIAKSIHMIPLGSREARKGPGMLNAVVIAGTSSAKRGMKADKVRDIVAVEYGGPATDSDGNLARRSDGMFYLPSYFFTRAATESAAFLGLEAGNILKNKEKSLGRNMTLSIKESDPNRKRARLQARKKDRALREIRKGEKNLRRAQNTFITMQRKFGRRSNDEMMRALNRRSMKAFNDAERTDGLNADAGNDRFIDPNFVLEDSSDRFLREGLAGQGSREFRMNSLGRVKRRIGQAGIGGGFVYNPSTQKISEIAASQFTSVYEVDGQSLIGRLPYMPVFDEKIYRRLLRTNSGEARKYLNNVSSAVGKFTPEYTQHMGDLLNNADFNMRGFLGQKNYNALKDLIGTQSSDVRTGLKHALGLNKTEIPNYQGLVGTAQGPNSEIGAIREALAGGRAKSNLTTLYLSEMQERLREVLRFLPGPEREIIMQKIRLQAASSASKVTNAIQTVWGRLSAGGVFQTPGDLFNALERTSILLEQGFARTTDTVGMLSAAYGMARSQEDKLKVVKSLLDNNHSKFLIQNMSTDMVIEKTSNSNIRIEITEDGFSQTYEDAIEEDIALAAKEQDDESLSSQSKTTNFKSESITVEKGVITVNPGANMDEVIKDMKDLMFQDSDKFTQPDFIADTIAQKFTFSTNEGVYAQALKDYYKRTGKFADIRGEGIGVIDGSSKAHNVNVNDSRISTSGDLGINNLSRGFKSSLKLAGRFHDNLLQGAVAPQSLAKEFFEGNLHTFYDSDNTAYSRGRKSYTQGHNLNALEFGDFEKQIGEYFDRIEQADAQRFIIGLVKEARDGKDSNSRNDRRIFIDKLFRVGSAQSFEFIDDGDSIQKTLDQNRDTINAIINYFKSKK